MNEHVQFLWTVVDARNGKPELGSLTERPVRSDEIEYAILPATEYRRLTALNRQAEPTADCPADHSAMRALCDNFCPECGVALNWPAEPGADARDAARYRWLRKPNSEIAGPAAYTIFPEHEPLFEQQLDAALDEAIAAERTGAKP